MWGYICYIVAYICGYRYYWQPLIKTDFSRTPTHKKNPPHIKWIIWILKTECSKISKKHIVPPSKKYLTHLSKSLAEFHFFSKTEYLNQTQSFKEASFWVTQQTNKLAANGSFVIEEGQADQGEKTKSKTELFKQKQRLGTWNKPIQPSHTLSFPKVRVSQAHVCLFTNKKMQTSHIWLISYVLQP